MSGPAAEGLPPRPRAAPDILAFVEDPGAAGYILDLPEACARQGLHCLLAAVGPARAFLEDRRRDFLPLSSPAEASAFLDRLRPRFVALGTADRPDALNFLLARECRARGIPAAGFVDGYGNLERRFGGTTGDPLAFAPDWMVVPDEDTRAAYTGFGFPLDRTAVCGHPALERVQRERRRLDALDRTAQRALHFPEAPPGVPVIVFFAEIFRTTDPGQYRLDGEYTLRGSGRYGGRTEIVLEEVLDALETLRRRGGGTGVHLVLRLHPKNSPEDFASFLGRVDQVSRGGPAHALVHAADAAVGMTTLLLAEAVYLGRPTLAVVPRPAEKAWLWTIGAGLTACAQTRPDLERALEALLDGISGRGPAPEPPDQEGALGRLVGFFEERLGGSAPK